MRNNIKTYIDIPDYVNLRMTDCGFTVSVTLNVNEFTKNWVNKKKYALPGSELYAFTKGKRNYVTIIRHYSNLNTISSACWNIASNDLRTLKIIIRLAKVDMLHNEINTLF